MTSQIRDAEGHPFPAFPYGETQSIAYTEVAAAIANGLYDGESPGPRLAVIWASTDCHIAIGPAAVATVNDKPLTAKVDTYVVVQPGDVISAIRQTANGTLYVTELN